MLVAVAIMVEHWALQEVSTTSGTQTRFPDFGLRQQMGKRMLDPIPKTTTHQVVRTIIKPICESVLVP